MIDNVIAALPCNLCGAVEVTVFSGRSRTGRPLRTVACIRCGLVWSDPRPHDSLRFYEEDYRLAYKGTFEPKPKHVLRAGRTALSRLEKIAPYLRARVRILDVGSGGGEFAYLLKTLGHEVQGVEPNRGYATYAASQYGLNIARGFIGDTVLPDGGFDLITIWHVLEHTEDPGAVLAQLRRSLSPEGILVVEVPNVEATCQSPGNTFHEAHLFNFNPATLGLMAAKGGLYPCTIAVSSDGGNITAVFRATPVGERPSLPGNHARVAAAVRAHTRLSHWLSAHPYRRLAGRIARMTMEWWATRRWAGARENLDALYARALSEPAKPRLSWKIVAVTYAAALLMEWLLLDELLPRNGWTEYQAMGAYAALQCAVVAGVVWMTNGSRTRRQLARIAAWAAPLFVLPVYC